MHTNNNLTEQLPLFVELAHIISCHQAGTLISFFKTYREMFYITLENDIAAYKELRTRMAGADLLTTQLLNIFKNRSFKEVEKACKKLINNG